MKSTQKSVTPPVMAGEGDCGGIHPNRGYVPSGALQGSGISSRVAEGIAKIVKGPISVVLHLGEVLVAQGTYRGKTSLFINTCGFSIPMV